jgi:hypothetical protein
VNKNYIKLSEFEEQRPSDRTAGNRRSFDVKNVRLQ